MKVLLLWKCATCVLQTLCLMNGQPGPAPNVGNPPSRVNGQNEPVGNLGSKEVVNENSKTTQGLPQSSSQSPEGEIPNQKDLAGNLASKVGKKAAPPFWILPKNDPSNAELMVM